MPKSATKLGRFPLKAPQTNEPHTRVSSSLSFMAASQPFLYTHLGFRTHLCKCSQKMAPNGGDSLKKRHKQNSPSRWSYCTKKLWQNIKWPPLGRRLCEFHIFPGLRPRSGKNISHILVCTKYYTATRLFMVIFNF